MREDELAVVPLPRLGLPSGTFDLAWLTRLGRATPTACVGIYRRQQELSWTEHLVERSRTSSRRPACWDGQSG